MSDKVYYHVGNDGPSIFEVETSKKKIEDLRLVLRWSEVDNSWTPPYRGKTAVRLEDNGNGAILTIHETENTKERVLNLGYDEIYMLISILDYYRKNTHESLNCTIRKTSEVTEI